jgi:hypothetical protein
MRHSDVDLLRRQKIEVGNNIHQFKKISINIHRLKMSPWVGGVNKHRLFLLI